MGINAKDLITKIIQPALTRVNMYSDAAAQLLAGTAAQESGMGTYLVQVEGPALGLFQMEPDSHKDIYANYLKFRPQDRLLIFDACRMAPVPTNLMPEDACLIYNMYYASIMCRIKYLRAKDPLPEFGDIQGQANYWKNNYNSQIGKGDTAAYMINYERFLKQYYLGLSS